MNRDYFCGGELDADMDAVEAVLRDVGVQLGVGPDQAAAGIVRIANNNMVNALKLVSLNRGFDPREFTLIAFGGGGGMHAVALAAELGVSKVVIPADAAVFSAWGMMMSDFRRDYISTRLIDLAPENAEAIENTLVETEDAARVQFEGEGIDAARLSFRRFGTFRYQNQEHTTEVALGENPVTADRIQEIRSAFETEYEREYTYRLDAPVEMVGIHVTATVRVGRAEIKEQELGLPSPKAAREVFPEGRLRAGRGVRSGDLRRQQAQAGHAVRRSGNRRRSGVDRGRAPWQRCRGRRVRQYRHSHS